MTWQDWTVAIVVLLCVGEIVRRAVHFFRSDKNSNPCAGCTSDCELRNLFERKRRECKKQQKPPRHRKKCCG